MKVLTKDLIDEALDWAVRESLDRDLLFEFGLTEDLVPSWRPSKNWAQGGPIIEQEKLELRPGLYGSEIWACWGQTQHGERLSQQGKTGPTPLIAAMRAFVASKMGDVINVPDELGR